MSETLVIRLLATDASMASWLVVDHTGAKSGPVTSGPLTDAASTAAGRRTIVLLPAAEVALAEPELPLRSGAKLAQAIPFALEEQLASDVETLHFAVGTRRAEEPGTPVAVAAINQMDRWRTAFEAAGVQPAAAHSESQFLPAAPNGVTLLLAEGMLHVRRADGLPYALDAMELAGALELALGPSPDAEVGEHVIFYVTPEDYERHGAAVESLRSITATLQVKLMPDGPLPLLAAQIGSNDAVNLLQGAYAPASSFGKELQAWRLPAGLAAAALLTFLTSHSLALWQLTRAEKKLDSQIAQTFRQVMPGSKMLDPRAQMEGLLRRPATKTGALLPTVSLLSQAVAQTPAIQLESLSYRGNSIEMRLVAPTIEALDGIKRSMSQNGASVDLQSATPRGEVVEGRLQVKLGAT